MSDIEIHQLFDKYHLKQQRRIKIYGKVYNKIIHKIKNVCNKGQSIFSTYYIIPEYMFGSPLYNQTICIAYCIIKLRKLGFDVTYTHPNFLYISWHKFINNYKYKIQPITLPVSNTSNINNPKSLEKTIVTKPNKIKSFFKNLNQQLINETEREDRSNNHNEILENIKNRANLLQKFDNNY